MKKRTYIFLDKNLPDIQKVVQAAHLALESGYIFSKPDSGHPSIIILAIEKSDFYTVKNYLMGLDIKFIDFYENLLGSITGIATEPLDLNQGKKLQHFSGLKLKHFKGE